MVWWVRGLPLLTKLNQSKGLETILALFFSKQGESPVLETVNQDEVLRAELSEFKHEVEKRLLAIEKRLKIKLANESVAISIEATTALQEIKESVANLSVESVIDLNESEIESAAVEEAIALNTLEDIPETAIPSSELVEVVNEVSATVDTSTSDDTVAVDNSPPEALEAPERPAIKPGKQHLKKLGR